MEPVGRKEDGTPQQMVRLCRMTNESQNSWPLMLCSSKWNTLDADIWHSNYSVRSNPKKTKVFLICVYLTLRLSHTVDDKGKSKNVTPTLARLEDLQDRWRDDYMANRLMRDQFRVSHELCNSIFYVYLVKNTNIYFQKFYALIYRKFSLFLIFCASC